MDAMVQLWLLLALLFFSFLPLSFSQNIEIFYPLWSPPAIPTPNPPNNPPISPPLTPVTPASPPPSRLVTSPTSPSSKRAVAKAIAATAAATLVIAGVFFFFFRKYSIARRRQNKNTDMSPRRDQAVISRDEFERFDGNLKGLIVDENGLDVLYWRKLQGGHLKTSFNIQALSNPNEEEEERQVVNRGDRRWKSESIQEIPLLHGKSSNSSARIRPEIEHPHQIINHSPSSNGIVLEAMAETKAESSTPPPPPRPPPPPPIPVKKNPVPPPPTPSPHAGGLASSLKPPPPPLPIGKLSNSKAEASPGESSTGTGASQAKLKPLHWDKVVVNNPDHSMVWDKVNNGSFRVDDDLMEALFGSVATNRKSHETNKVMKYSNPISSSNSPVQIFLLDPHKSQNTAIVLRSLSISRQEILNALLEGQGLNGDTLEKLTKIAPNQEEETRILEFADNPTKLADAESFLYYLLKAVPSAFTRLDAMLFRSNYSPEILHLNEVLKTLEIGCKELRTRGLFLKLLEAILKAGNRMNAGTTRGNAQAFNLTSLRKLSDVKSTDGKTTLLHFVVQEVVRSEGKRCVLNRNHSFSRSSSWSSNASNTNSSDALTNEEREKEYIMLGLPMVGGLTVEFSNVRKAATIDYEAFINGCSVLTVRVGEIRQLLARMGPREEGGFAREMKRFLENAEEELKMVRKEQTRVMEIVKKTAEYYQAGASKDKGVSPLQLFVIVKDFLGMVDQACVDIARNLQKKKTVIKNIGSSSPPLPVVTKVPVRFPNLPAHFMSDKSRTSSSGSDSEDGF